MTGKPVTNSAVVELYTSIAVTHRRLTAEIPSLTGEQRQIQIGVHIRKPYSRPLEVLGRSKQIDRVW
jgi:hypothetical protein